MAATRRRYVLVWAVGVSTLLTLTGTAHAVIPPPNHEDIGDGIFLDARAGTVMPTADQEAGAAALGAAVRWTRYGTPASLVRFDGPLATGLSSDPVEAAREFLTANAGLFRLDAAEVAALELLGNNPIGDGRAVLLQQRFGSLPAGTDGLVALAVRDGEVLYVTSSLAGHAAAPPTPAIEATEGWLRAAAGLGLDLEAVALSGFGSDGDWTTFQAAGLDGVQRVRLVAVPTYTQGVRPAYETIVLDELAPLAVTTFVDAVTGDPLVRLDRVAFQGEPAWEVFPANPPLDYSATDTRQRWCWFPATGCDRVLSLSSPRGGTDGEWDRIQGRVPGVVLFFIPSNTTLGNNADTAEAWLSPLTPAEKYRPVATDRDYTFPWQNTWYESNCDPAELTPTGNDIDAAIVNLFAMHNRMHNWSYHLGFTERTWNLQSHNFGQAPDARENDPEIGDAQAGALFLGPGQAVARDNANQITLNDGIPGITNMYLWQSLPNAAYVPCVDGDFDMAVIGHEYTHATSNRMVAGPDGGLDQTQSRSMGESWSDLAAAEYLNAHRLVPTGGENPFAVGAYVTGDHQRGVRNYAMNASPLNYSQIQYDFGSQVHADGEIWSAVNFDIRRAMVQRYGTGDAVTQERCNNGDLPAQNCPGNRRWIQLVFDAWLLVQGSVDMVEARNAMLVADQLRFGGANQDLLWEAFARRGFGEGATSRGGNDNDPQPDFASPLHKEAVVTFKPAATKGGPAPKNVEIYVGDYEARVVPVADTVPDTPSQLFPRDEVAELVAGRYTFVARADGFGHVRFERTVKAGQKPTVTIPMPANVASTHRGATASGDGSGHVGLIDDTERTQWISTGSPPVQGRQVTVNLAGDAPVPVGGVRVSAMLNPSNPGVHRFAALRSFQILVCTAGSGVACDQPGQFTLLFTSPADAFPGEPFRPRAPELILRSFDVPDTTATHVRLRVVTNQCTGNPAFQGDQDNDPTNDSDCVASTSNAALLPPQGGNVIATELQVVGG